MKRILALILSVVMLFLLVACGNEKNAISNENTNSSTVQDSNVSSNNADNNTEDNLKNNTDNSSNAESTTSDTTKPTPPPSTPSDDFKENKDTIISETIINTPQKEDCKHKNMTYVPNEDGDVPTCTKSGYYLKWCPDCFVQIKVEAEALGHTGGTAKCTRKAVCSRCRNEYGEVDKNNHVGININCKEEAKKATCETEGYEGHIKYCSFCKTVIEYGKTIPPLGHLLTPAPVYDKATDKIKAYCQRQGCDGGKYTDVEPLKIELKNGSLNIYGGCYPRAKCYYTPANGTRREIELQGWPASQDLTWCGYYWNYRCDEWSLGNKYEICVYDNSGRTATAIYEVVKTASGGYTFQKVN